MPVLERFRDILELKELSSEFCQVHLFLVHMIPNALRDRSNPGAKTPSLLQKLDGRARNRDARESLLRDEQELVEMVKSVAAKRRNLPPGGQLKEDYVFEWANNGKGGQRVRFSELFADKSTLLLYSFMFGPNWDNPCS